MRSNPITPEYGPLHGLRVMLTGVAFAGPFAARWLGDMGAEIIKIEIPGSGDTSRIGRRTETGVVPKWISLGRNMNSFEFNMNFDKEITLDLNGKTLTPRDYMRSFVAGVGSNVTITGGGTILVTYDDQINVRGGTLNLEDVTLDATDFKDGRYSPDSIIVVYGSNTDIPDDSHLIVGDDSRIVYEREGDGAGGIVVSAQSYIVDLDRVYHGSAYGTTIDFDGSI